jgi:hypothetical protein
LYDSVPLREVVLVVVKEEKEHAVVYRTQNRLLPDHYWQLHSESRIKEAKISQ